jgi:hypothetical protein
MKVIRDIEFLWTKKRTNGWCYVDLPSWESAYYGVGVGRLIGLDDVL